MTFKWDWIRRGATVDFEQFARSLQHLVNHGWQRGVNHAAQTG
jgi:hypothetical protein